MYIYVTKASGNFRHRATDAHLRNGSLGDSVFNRILTAFLLLTVLLVCVGVEMSDAAAPLANTRMPLEQQKKKHCQNAAATGSVIKPRVTIACIGPWTLICCISPVERFC